MKVNIAIVVASFYFLISCNSNYTSQIGNPSEITSSLDSFFAYNNKYIFFSRDFIALDENENLIDKKTFLKKMETGHYLPLKIYSEKDEEIYKTYLIKKWKTIEISYVLMNNAKIELGNFSKEGRNLPHFNFVDLENKKYDANSIKNKIIVIKFWFLACPKCISEISPMNEMIKSYEKNKDLIFMSFALDQNTEIKEFIKKNPLKYPVFANQRKYVNDTLGIIFFPTYIILGKDGKISKVVNSFKELKYELTIETSK
ncbi:TlpA family protein disulfide reductase [Flavobacterium zhairuonense]|uniref:TlpA family protein disulfide reductase n=1 Tax=Flavobacterium zhairuonense TaxID=2493631 RepID=UPI00104AF728|nr:TlpA disulfide reductase family protein [Flavobacterium zhairuonense]KAF2511515.1 TlpA family protein disulfide reductase [Flavobacterium zhairuonense]